MLCALWDKSYENATKISQEILIISIDQMSFEILFLILLTHLPVSNELISMSMLLGYTPWLASIAEYLTTTVLKKISPSWIAVFPAS